MKLSKSNSMCWTHCVKCEILLGEHSMANMAANRRGTKVAWCLSWYNRLS
mgnify:CR=1 FL=1